MLAPCFRRCDPAASHAPALQVFPPLPQSPSLVRARTPAYELKFVLDETQAALVEARLMATLTIDPHANPDRENSYQITTLYCDTADWKVFHRVGRHRLQKFRLRRYDRFPTVYLERKARLRRQVRKFRAEIPLAELKHFASPIGTAGWGGERYQRHLVRGELRPVCLVRYDRVAYFGHNTEGALRLTFDRRIVGSAASGWSLDPQGPSRSLLDDKVICEFKFQSALPAVFKQVLHDLQLNPGWFSKYRTCIQTTIF